MTENAEDPDFQFLPLTKTPRSHLFSLHQRMDLICETILRKVCGKTCLNLKCRGGVFLYLYTLVISFFKLSVREELEVFFFDLYPTQTTTSLHATKCISWETSALLAHEKAAWINIHRTHGIRFQTLCTPCLTPLQMFTSRLQIKVVLSCCFFHPLRPQLFTSPYTSADCHWCAFFIAILTLFLHKRKSQTRCVNRV